MKILHTIQSLDPAWGGIAAVLPELAANLVRAGYECRIATLAGGRYGNPPPIDGVDVRSFTAPDRSALGRSRDFDACIGDLVREADVVHVHGLWTGQNRSTGSAARKIGRPYVVTPHSMMMPWAWGRSRWKKLLAGWAFEHRNLRRAALLHALADGEADHVRALGFNDRIVVIPNGLDVSSFDDPPAPDELERRFPQMKGRRLLLFLGRLSPQKGIIQGMKACLDALPAAKDWHLTVAGPDPMGMRPMLEAAVGRKGLAGRVTFTGMMERRDVRALLARASLLLQPSLSEGLSMSILEALAAGLPAIVSPACNLPEVEEARAGVIVEPHRADIAAALRRLVQTDEAELRAMGRRARGLAREKYDWSVLIPRYQAMYEGLVSPR